MSSVNELTDENFTSTVSAQEIAVVDVYASWCGSCRLFAPTFNDTAAAFPQFKFYKIEAEKNTKFREGLAIDNLPFVAVFHRGSFVGGKSVSKKEGLMEMLQVIQQKMGGAS